MGMDDGQSTRSHQHQEDRHAMKRRMWVLGQLLRRLMSKLLLCTPDGWRAYRGVSACPRQEGVLSGVNCVVDHEMGGEGLTSPQIRHCRPAILT